MAKSVRRKADARKFGKAVAKFDCGAEVREIKKLHAGIENSTRGTLKPAIEIGQKLLKIKKNLKSQNRNLGEPKQRWMQWCKEHLNMAHRTVTSYISAFKAHKEGKLKGMTSLIEAYQFLSERTTRKRTAIAKYEVRPVPLGEAESWLRSLTQISGTLEIKVKTAAQAVLALKQGLKQHENAVEKGKRLVVVFEVGREEIPALKIPTAQLPETIEVIPGATAA